MRYVPLVIYLINICRTNTNTKAFMFSSPWCRCVLVSTIACIKSLYSEVVHFIYLKFKVMGQCPVSGEWFCYNNQSTHRSLNASWPVTNQTTFGSLCPIVSTRHRTFLFKKQDVFAYSYNIWPPLPSIATPKTATALPQDPFFLGMGWCVNIDPIKDSPPGAKSVALISDCIDVCDYGRKSRSTGCVVDLL